MSDKKLVKTVLDATTLTCLAAGMEKKAVTENFTSNPSNNAMNYVKFTVLMVVNMALKQYLKDQKIFPQNAYLKGLCIYSIASVAIMAGDAIRDAVAFIGSNYLARFLSGYSSKAPFEGKKKT